MIKTHPEAGQALILIVFAIIGLIGITGLAVDGGNAFAERRRAQNAADAAALAGAVERINNNTASWVNAVYASAAHNGYNNDGVTNVVRVFSPPISGPNAGNVEYIQVQIVSYTHTYFAPVVGIQQITNEVEAVSRTKTPEYKPILGGAAVISLAPTSDCDKHKSFYIHAEATLDIRGGGVFINSNNPSCALIEQGEGSIRINDGHPIQIVGGASIQKPKLLTPYPPVNVPSVAYPPPFYMPKVGCGLKEAEVSLDGHTMTPGNWDEDFPPLGVDTLSSGIYCIDGDFTLAENRQLSGNGVVIKMEAGQLHIAGSAQINLSAPQTGDLAGLLIYQPMDNNHTMVLNGAEDSSFTGVILAPGAQILIKGLASGSAFHSQIIGYTVEVDGDSNVVIKYNDDQNYDALTMPEVQFSQ